MGIGSTAWRNRLKTRPHTSPSDEYFPGPLAIQAFNAAGGLAYDGGKVPVDRDRAHWRYSVFGGEVMAGGSPVISAITVQALADLGHVVDVSKADPFTLPGASQGDAVAGAGADGVEGGGGPGFEFDDDIVRGPVMVVDSTGKVVRVIRN